MLIIDRFAKRPISIPCKKTVDAKEAAQMYIQLLYWIYSPLLTIVSDCSLQFVSAF